MLVVISPAGGREEPAEEEVDGALEGLPGREFRAFKHGRMNEAADGLQPEFDGEGRIDLGADLALGQTVNFKPNSDKLAAPLMSDDITGIQPKDVADRSIG